MSREQQRDLSRKLSDTAQAPSTRESVPVPRPVEPVQDQGPAPASSGASASPAPPPKAVLAKGQEGATSRGPRRWAERPFCPLQEPGECGGHHVLHRPISMIKASAKIKITLFRSNFLGFDLFFITLFN